MAEIELTQGLKALVDDEDFARVAAAGPWYAYRQSNGRVYSRHSAPGAEPRKPVTVLMHRFVLGVSDPKAHVDHKDHNGLNNRRANLRAATPSQNTANSRKRRDTSSRYKGVHFDKEKGKWRARIKHNGTEHHLGYFENEAQAAHAHYIASLEYFGEYRTTKLCPKDDTATVIAADRTNTNKVNNIQAKS